MTSAVDVLLVRYCPRPSHAEAFDRTMEALSGIPCVHVMVHDNTRHNLGLARGRNRLLAQATAPVVALMDFDVDWKVMDFLSMGAAACRHGVGAVTPVSDPFNGRVGGERIGEEWQDVAKCSCQCTLIRRDLLTAMGGVDERYFVAYADWDLLNRLAVSGLALRQHNRSRIKGHMSLSSDLPTKREIWDRDRAEYRKVWGETRWN